MKSARLLEHFDRIAEAPEAVTRLRQFVLDLAVRGKLVAQNLSHEPASELIEQFQEKKQQLVIAGKIKKKKPLPPIDKVDSLGFVPSNWQVERLGNLSTVITKGSTPTSYGHSYTDFGVNFIKVESIKENRLLPKNVKNFISDETHEFLARSQLEAGDILFSIAGSIGTCAVVTKAMLPANTNQALAIIRGTQCVFNSEFLLTCVQSSVAEVIQNKARGGAMNNVSLTDIQNFVVPVPPLAEQHRIVAKVDELMALCDELEAAQDNREAHRDRLVTASLHQILKPDATASASKGGRKAWSESNFLENLPRITTRPEHIQQFRQTLLNLAVQGRIVPQNSNDTPATSLVEHIQEITGKEAGIGKGNQPFILPRGWVWSTVGAISTKTGSGSTPRGGKSVYKASGVPFLRSQNVHNDGLKLDDVAYIDSSTHAKMRGTALVSGDLLLNITGGSIGRCCRLPDGPIQANISQHVSIIRLAIEEMRDFAHKVILSPFFQSYIFDEQTGAGRGGLPKKRMDKIPIPVPPLDEQHRIVTKVDELMALCDQLEAKLTTAQTDSRRLLDAVLQEAL